MCAAVDIAVLMVLIRQASGRAMNVRRVAWVNTAAAALCMAACTSGEVDPSAAGPSQAGATAGAANGSNGGPATGSAGTGASISTALNLTGSPQYLRLVRLTNGQWARSVQDILELASPSQLESGFQSPVAGSTDFANNELVLAVDQRAVADFQSAAEALAKQVTASSTSLSQIYAGTDAQGFIATLGRRAFRRPLTSEESAAYLTLFNSGATLTGTASAFAKGAGLVIRAVLQSPFFVYRTELGDAGTPLSSYEIAAKLSLWLRGTTPSDALLDSAAVAGKLDNAEAVAAIAGTMLEEPAAAKVIDDFHAELLHFDRYSTITKLDVAGYDPSLNAEYLEASSRFFDKIFSQGLGLREVLTSTKGFVGPGLAALYGVPAPASGYEERELGATRVGYFSQVPFLSLYGLNSEADSIHRGVTINLDLLCAVLGPPAAELPPVPALMPGQTNRVRISSLTAGCGGACHNQQINPIGFAFDHFDGIGRYQEAENGNLPIDSSGTFEFVEGKKSFQNAGDLMREMADGSQAHTCYSKKLASFAMQRDIVAQDRSLLDALAKVSRENGSVKRVILELVRSDAFRIRTAGNL
jgi:uncharacterized protein DUF1592/uncharacterized protein DUF1595/uncharacterized protein DUF1588/uncharacterized protein DUF1585/uncharacterized protein DUF1587